MTWKIITPEQLAVLPSWQGLELLPRVRYGYHEDGKGYIEYAWASSYLSNERMQRMQEEAQRAIARINGQSHGL